MKVYEGHPYPLEAPLDRFFAVFWASPSALRVSKGEETLLSLSYDGKTVSACFGTGGSRVSLSGVAAPGAEVVFTRDFARVALYADGALLGEGFFRGTCDAAGAVASANKLFHLVPGYVYTAGWESLADPLPDPCVAAFRPAGGGTVTEALEVGDRVFYRYTVSGGNARWGQLRLPEGRAERLPVVTEISSPAVVGYGTGAAVAAFGGWYFFCPVFSEEGNYVGAFASKNGVQFAASPLRLLPGGKVSCVDVAHDGDSFLLAATLTGGGRTVLSSPDLYHWEKADRPFLPPAYRRLIVHDGSIQM